MDVFYYWKDHAADMKAGRIGRFKSTRNKLSELQAGSPDRIWVFKTPKGLKGQVQLLARLCWTDTAVVQMERKPDESYMFYDPDHARSVSYVDSDQPAAIEAATTWVGVNFPRAIHANFQGENGQQALRGAAIKELERIAGTLTAVPFQTVVTT